jgi:hypothetical protein
LQTALRSSLESTTANFSLLQAIKPSGDRGASRRVPYLRQGNLDFLQRKKAQCVRIQIAFVLSTSQAMTKLFAPNLVEASHSLGSEFMSVHGRKAANAHEAFQWAAKQPDTYLKSIGFRDRASFNRWHKSLVATERAVWRQAVAERKTRIR